MSEDSCVTKGRASVGPSKSHNSILGILLSSRRKDTFALCTSSLLYRFLALASMLFLQLSTPDYFSVKDSSA
jgi:hypothetical protein